MSPIDWLNVIDEAARLGAVRVQFIGGEPTLHRQLPNLLSRALSMRMDVEVFTNLVHVAPAMWALFERPGVRLATSYCSSDRCAGSPEHRAGSCWHAHSRRRDLMTAPDGGRRLAEDQVSSRVHVGSRGRMRERWGGEEYTAGLRESRVTRGRISEAPPAVRGGHLRPREWPCAS